MDSPYSIKAAEIIESSSSPRIWVAALGDAPYKTKKSGEVPSVWFTTAYYAKLGGETAIVRTGDFNADTNVLGFG